MVWAALFFLGLTAWMILAVFFVKWRMHIADQRERALAAVWEELFFAAAIGDEVVSLPVVKRGDRVRILKIWCHIGSNVAGESLERLALIARRLGLDQVALDILAPGGLRLRNPSSVELLLALSTAERLLLFAAWDRLKQIVQDGPAPLDRYAARALVALDAPAAAPAILPALVRQGRWARHLVEDLIEAGVTGAAASYAELLSEVDDEAVPGLALLLDRCNDPHTLPAVRARLAAEKTQDPEALAALLNTLSVVGGASERKLAQSFVGHEQWFVRMRSAQALGRCGDQRDGLLLDSLLCDENWYTRYHAARALLRIAGLGQRHLREFAGRTDDRFAHDMALHVLGETEAPAVSRLAAVEPRLVGGATGAPTAR